MSTGFKRDSGGWYIGKDPDENLDYSIDWSRLLGTGETITAALWTLQTGIAGGGDQVAGSVTQKFISGGTAGTTYMVSCRITTSMDRIFDRSFRIICRNI